MSTITIESLTTKVGKLLSKAESTTSADEAQALFAKAQELATRHQIDMAVARMNHAASEAPDVLEERTLTLGLARSAGLAQKVRLFSAVGHANGIRMAISHDSTTAYPIGFASDLDTVEQLYFALVEQMVRFGNEWVNNRSWAGDTYYNDTHWDVRPVNARIARRTFYEGFTSAIQSRLNEAKRYAEEAAQAAEEPSVDNSGKQVSVTALALRDKDKEVNEFTQKVYARRRIRGTYRGGRSSGSHSGSRSAGHSAGMQASMSGRAAIA